MVLQKCATFMLYLNAKSSQSQYIPLSLAVCWTCNFTVKKVLYLIASFCFSSAEASSRNRMSHERDHKKSSSSINNLVSEPEIYSSYVESKLQKSFGESSLSHLSVKGSEASMKTESVKLLSSLVYY